MNNEQAKTCCSSLGEQLIGKKIECHFKSQAVS